MYWRPTTQNRASMKTLSCFPKVLIAPLGRNDHSTMVLSHCAFVPLTRDFGLVSLTDYYNMVKYNSWRHTTQIREPENKSCVSPTVLIAAHGMKDLGAMVLSPCVFAPLSKRIPRVPKVNITSRSERIIGALQQRIAPSSKQSHVSPINANSSTW